MSSLKWLSVEGRNPVYEALRARVPIEQILLDTQARSGARLSEIMQMAREQHVTVEKVARRYLDKRSQTGVHQGVIAFVEPAPEFSLNQLLDEAWRRDDYPFFIILPQVLYEHNLGAVMRTAEAVGADGIIIPNRTSGLTPTVVRTSMGACFWIPLIQMSIFSAMKTLDEEGVYILGADMAASEPHWSMDLTGPLTLVIGGEDQGISDPVRKYCHGLVSIPMFGEMTSLNLSVSAGIILYERARQIAKSVSEG